MEAKPRPPRKFFFSPVGTPTPVKLTFLSEPVWTKRDKGEALVAAIARDGVSPEELEQYTPDAYDLSVALVAVLGGTVNGKSCTVAIETRKIPSRKGGEVAVISKFTVY